jgi:hypothetical protein
MGFLSKIFKKAQVEIKMISNKDIKKNKPKHVFLKRKGKLTKFKVTTNSAGIATLIEVK